MNLSNRVKKYGFEPGKKYLTVKGDYVTFIKFYSKYQYKGKNKNGNSRNKERKFAEFEGLAIGFKDISKVIVIQKGKAIRKGDAVNNYPQRRARWYGFEVGKSYLTKNGDSLPLRGIHRGQGTYIIYEFKGALIPSMFIKDKMRIENNKAVESGVNP